MVKEITFPDDHPAEHLAGQSFELFEISWDDEEIDNFRKNGSCWRKDPKGKFYGFVNPLTGAVERVHTVEM